MKTRSFLLAILVCCTFACDKEGTKDETDEKTTIDGQEFNPTQSSVVNNGENLLLSFEEGSKSIEIITNDTVEGTYAITTQSLKSTALMANLTYTDGTTSYIAKSGNVTITAEGDGVISGTYNATVFSEEVELAISSGVFSELDVELDIEEEIPPVTEESINDTLILCYNNLESFVEFSFLFDAVYSNTITAPSTSWDDIYGHSQNTTNVKATQLWNDGYDIILQANFVLEQAEEIITDEETKNSVTAQAKAIRAYAYNTLSTWFGELPLIMVYEPESWSRASQAEVLALIEADADAAIEYLPSSWSESESYKVTKTFAQGLLCRVHLTNAAYSDAMTLAQQIINSGEYALDATVDNITSASTEIYWGFEKGDNEEFNTFFTNGSYVPVLRYTETMLVFAEAANNLGQQMEAMNSINMMKSRRGEGEIMTIDNATIRNQWEVELAQEGSIFNTMKRYGAASGELGIDEYKLVLPIPQSVLDSYPSMTQNPGY